MILSKNVSVNVNISNYKRLLDLGYDVEGKFRKPITINVEHLSNGSRSIIDASCDVCQKKLKTSYVGYITSFNKHQIYACSVKCGKANSKLTCLHKYGVDHNFKSESVKEAKRKTFLQNYGVDNPSKSKIVTDKIKKTQTEKFGTLYVNTEEFKEKFKNTCLAKYGVEHHSQSDIIKDKKIQTNLTKRGTKTPFTSEPCKEKSRNTCLLKYGVEHHNQRPKNSQLLSDINYFKDTELTYQGSYELDFINTCIDKNVEINNGRPVKYNLNGEIKTYYPDFYIKELNLIIEIKSTYTLNVEYDKNMAKQTACIEQGYNFIFIVDKNYNEFFNKLVEYEKS